MGKIIKRIKESGWKSVAVKGVDFSELEGLSTFEELTDYDLTSVQNIRKVSKNNIEKKKKKRDSNILKVKDKKNEIAQNLNQFKENVAIPKIKRCSNTFSVTHSVSSQQNEQEISDANNKHNSSTFSDDHLPWSNIFVPPVIISALLENGFKEPTPIQNECIPPAIKGRRDILGAAETGSGKTLAFGIPMLYGIMKCLEKDAEATSNDDKDEIDGVAESEQAFNIENDDEMTSGCVKVIDYGPIPNTCTKQQQKNVNKRLWGLVLTPTRELAMQVKNHLTSAAKYTGIEIAVIVGGMAVEKQRRVLNYGPQIVVATPGRLWELITLGEEHFNDIAKIRFLVIDEADRMTEINHFPELQSLLKLLNADPELQKQRQNFVFSATLSLVHEPPDYIRKKKKRGSQLTPRQKLQEFVDVLGITDPKIVDMTNETVVSNKLTESYIYCSFEDKDRYLYYFLQCYPGRTLVFCNSISCVRRLVSLFNILKCQPLPLHACMMQRQRLKNLDRFRDNPTSVLLATDVAARGLDIPKVQHVIHYQVPRTTESYVHRSGRTARGNEQGLALILIEPTEMDAYNKLRITLNKERELPEFPIYPLVMDIIKERVLLAREIDTMELKTRRLNVNIGWAKKAAEEMDIILDDNIVPEELDSHEAAELRRAIKSRRMQLNYLLSQKVVPFTRTTDIFHNPLMSVKALSTDAIETAKSTNLASKGKKRTNVKKVRKDN